MALHTAEYKIILLGEPGVGKTNYFFRLRDDVFVGSSVSTVSQGVEHMTFKATVDGEEVKVQVQTCCVQIGLCVRACLCMCIVHTWLAWRVMTLFAQSSLRDNL